MSEQGPRQGSTLAPLVLGDARPAVDALPPRYEDLGLIATGGFGEVRRVRDRQLQSTLAYKVLKADRVDDDVKRRFFAEARITAWLNHPGIVAVQDVGELADGRVWYTMQEVRGQTLSSVIRSLHAGDPAWSLRRVVDVLLRASQAVASAHAVGVIHRDLKPDNLMIGPFGEVRVMDWGLARRLDAPDELGVGVPSFDLGGTEAGVVMGTPAYMPPEQARGDNDAVGPWSDVYALGATLYEALSGWPPYGGGGRAAWMGRLRGAPTPIRDAARISVPDELVQLCELAMADDPHERFPDAGALAHVLGDWLEGARLRAEAEALVAQARARLPEAASLRADAERREAEARVALSSVAPSAPVEAKVHAWRLESAGQDDLAAARRLEAEVIRDLRAALTRYADLPSAHDLLADLYRDRLVDAEIRGDPSAAVEADLALRAHDRGRHRAWLQGDGALTLVTDPPGARVEVFRYVEQDRRLVEVPAGVLGPTPLLEVPLPRGSYVLVIHAEGRAPVRYPVAIGRLEHWHGVRPGDTAPFPIALPPRGALGDEDAYVPAGWFWSGGDLRALDPLPRRRLWVDAFVMRRFPVTLGAYIAFLDGLATQSRLAERSEHGLREGEAPFLVFEHGRHRLTGDPRVGQEPWDPLEPVAFVAAPSADAYAAEAPGGPWGLPEDLEFEKAARGVDGRFYPWGGHLDPSFTCMHLSHSGIPGRARVTEYAIDESPYGVRHLAGNVRTWCANPYRSQGPEGDIVRPEAAPDGALRMVRGGNLLSAADICRSASRFAWRIANRSSGVGLRLSRRLPPRPWG